MKVLFFLQVRILLNKADSLSPTDAFRALSQMSWQLSPMFGGNPSPKFYAVSLRERDYNPAGCVRLVRADEEKLFQDLMVLPYLRVDNKAALLRRHAVRNCKPSILL